MLFSSMVFLWAFLPIVFILYRLADHRYRNSILLIASLVFYAWGEPEYILLMIITILINYAGGILVDGAKSKRGAYTALAVCVAVNLIILFYFKYFNFLIENLNAVLHLRISVRTVVLPIGISFYTFQALSYVVDVYRGKYAGGDTKAQYRFIDLAIYVSSFPQLIAGPIVKYHDVADQIRHRELTSQQTAYGITRFSFGMAKKVLLSNTFALAADQIFALSGSALGTPTAWLGAICYTLQIYYDFSGYSDMAVGLGKMFGFTFMENFNLPYLSASIREFWRRWHISLSTWFREYLYIPLGGSRKGAARTCVSLLIVFLLTGLWHGASWNFLVWGLYHGFFLLLERLFLARWLDKNRLKVLNHLYAMLVVAVGWVFFRADTLADALSYLRVMFTWTSDARYPLMLYLDGRLLLTLVLGVLLCGPAQALFPKFQRSVLDDDHLSVWKMAASLVLLSASIVLLASGTYNPFIYFRF